jgi:hypothetical protein
MSSRDRLIVPAYTSPVTGTRTTWTYRTAFTTGFKKRLDSRRFVGVDGTNRRDLGFDIDDYPMACIFNDVDHDLTARDFVETLKETITPGNPGILEHPRDGVVPVVVADVMVTHNPTKDGSETIVEVVFQHQTELPGNLGESPIVATEKQLANVNAASASDFNLAQSIANAGDRLATIQEMTSQINKIGETMGAVVAANGQALTTFNTIKDDILRNIDTLVKAPLTLATQTQQLVQTVLATPGEFSAKAQGWKDLYTASVGESQLFDVSRTDANRNRVSSQSLTAVSALSANLANVVIQIDDFPSKTAAFDALADAQQQILNLAADLDYMQDTFESEIMQKRYFSNRETYSEFQKLIRIAKAGTQQAAQRLRTSVSIKTQIDTHLLQLAADYHQDVSDETLDFIIAQNGLTIDNMFLIPRGSEIEI